MTTDATVEAVVRRVTIALHIDFPSGGDPTRLEIAGRAQQCLAKVMHDAYSDHGIDDLEIVVQHMGLSDEVAEDK